MLLLRVHMQTVDTVLLVVRERAAGMQKIVSGHGRQWLMTGGLQCPGWIGCHLCRRVRV